MRYDRLGRLSKAFQGTTTVDSMTYDNLGRITSNLQTVNGAVYAVAYGYDLYKRLRVMILPDGSIIQQRWTPRGLLDTLWSGGRQIARYGYKFGLETSRNLANGIAVAQGYDAGGRVNSLAYTLAGQTLPSLGYGYDPSGNRKLIRRNHATTTSEAIAYTPDNQVSGWGKGTADAAGAIASPTASQSWSLDSRGNWTGWTQNGTAQARTHSSANELTTLGTTSVTWDAAGNLTNDGTLTNIWGPRGLLDTAKQGTTIKGAYGYDALGRRSLKVVGALKTISIYDGWQCVWQKVTGSGTDTTKTYLYGNYIDEPVCLIRKWGTTSDTSYYLQGNNYNVEALTDRTGGIVERYAYSPYGAVTAYTGKGADGAWFTGDDVAAAGSARGNALTFQGRELDGETGNYQYRFRDYNSSLGEFIERDPIRYLAKAKSLYRFVDNAPCNRSDPSGLIVPAVVLCVVLAEEAIIPTIALAAGVMAICKNDEKEKEKERDRNQYHSRCDEPPPPGLSPCELWKFYAQRAKDCIKLRQNFANKWFGGGYDDGHLEAIAQKQREITNNEDKIRRLCCGK